ncbi:MAG: HlyD family efflux transporter periplasmic adaptor subunit [Sphingobacteriales bacterium]|nr:MAG: HlyD family efflux transporter periplasmic adaptor subunit [Sphingobacteriales bacterium]
MFLEENTGTSGFEKYKSFQKAMEDSHHTRKIKWILGVFIVAILTLFLPWTQNIQSRGEVATLNPEQRQQEINSIIAGRIVKWYVQDGDMVNKGDTILQITEIKDDYLDPQLTQRTAEQLKAKTDATQFYKDKVGQADIQLTAMAQSLSLKMEQLRNKVKQYTLQVQSDSVAMIAANNQLKIANEQLKRQKEMFDAGLKSLTEFEQRQQLYQESLAKKIASENKFYNGKNELLNIKIDLSATTQEYAEKISKTTGDKFTAQSQASTGESEVAKLANQLANYKLRKGFYFILAPQNGQVLQTVKAGIGETVKDGEKLVAIVPLNFSKAIEIYVNPIDLPLISKGERVQIQFDGFPAIVFSGWPQASYGLFTGKIAAIDNNIDATGKFKVWVKPDLETKVWPSSLKLGTGCQTIALLNNVPIWYELWRQLNSFPPDFYSGNSKDDKPKKVKK